MKQSVIVDRSIIGDYLTIKFNKEFEAVEMTWEMREKHQAEYEQKLKYREKD
jgi:hypothetical protein